MRINSSLSNSIFMGGVDEKSHLNPFRAALFLTLSYVILLSLYILISGRIAEFLSETVVGLANIEITKGIVYTVVTGFLLFFIIFVTLKEISQKDNFIIKQNKSIISTEPLIMTGIYSASVCHDINNLMTVVVGNLELLKKSEYIDNKDLKLVENISNSSVRLVDLVRRMMNYGKNYIPGEWKNVNMSNLLIETVKFAKVHRKLKSCQVRCEIKPSLYINLNSTLVERTLMNLLLNASEATGLSGKILIKLFQNDKFATLEVHDNGPGVPDDMKELIFESFYTTKSGGSGLGLLSIKMCADQHNGTIQLKESDLGGACFSLTFPVKDEQSIPQQAA